jgi:hypothetical protein
MKNVGFLIKNLPFAWRKAEKHYKRAIEVSNEIGAKGILGQAYLDLGILYKLKKRNKQSMECIQKASQAFEQCNAVLFSEQADKILTSL